MTFELFLNATFGAESRMTGMGNKGPLMTDRIFVKIPTKINRTAKNSSLNMTISNQMHSASIIKMTYIIKIIIKNISERFLMLQFYIFTEVKQKKRITRRYYSRRKGDNHLWWLITQWIKYILSLSCSYLDDILLIV